MQLTRFEKGLNDMCRKIAGAPIEQLIGLAVKRLALGMGGVEKRYGYHYDPTVTLERHESYVAEARKVITVQQAVKARKKLQTSLRSDGWLWLFGKLFQKLIVP